MTRLQILPNDTVHLELFGKLDCPAMWTGLKHDHKFWEMLFLASGDGVYTVEQTRHAVKAGDLCLMAPGVQHRFEARSATTMFYFGFEVSVSSRRFVIAQLPIVLNTLPAIEVFIQELAPLRGIQAEADLPRFSPNILSFIIHFVDTYLIKPVSEGSTVSPAVVMVERAKAYLRLHFDRNVTNEELSNAISLSPNHLGDLFRRSTGQTPKQFHLKVRMEKAFDLLVRGDSITTIADALGFDSIHHFSRRFKEYFGTSPTMVRDHREGHLSHYLAL